MCIQRHTLTNLISRSTFKHDFTSQESLLRFHTKQMQKAVQDAHTLPFNSLLTRICVRQWKYACRVCNEENTVEIKSEREDKIGQSKWRHVTVLTGPGGVQTKFGKRIYNIGGQALLLQTADRQAHSRTVKSALVFLRQFHMGSASFPLQEVSWWKIRYDWTLCQTKSVFYPTLIY